jgi:hypothetical protein
MNLTPTTINNMTLVSKVFRKLCWFLFNPKELLLRVKSKRKIMYEDYLNSLWSTKIMF